MKSLLCVIIVLFCFNPESYAQKGIIQLSKSSTAPVIDGVIDENEWKDAKVVFIDGLADTQTTVLLQYDDDNLYVAFKNLVDSNNIRLNPEVLVHTNTEHLIWNDNCFWFHSSYSNCLAVGQYYNWEDCTMYPIGWKANTFPFIDGNNNIEFKISFSKLNITPSKGRQLKIAFKLSDPLEQHNYWPETASISSPLTWGFIEF